MVQIVKRQRKVVRRPWFDSCQECRTRRVKCDANRPSCIRCQKIGRKCTYSIWTIEIPLAEKNDEQAYDSGIDCSPISPSLTLGIRQIPRMPGSLPSSLDERSRISFEFYMHVGMEMQTRFSTHPPAVRYAARYALTRATTEPIWMYLLATAGAAWQARLPLVHSGVAQPLEMSQYDMARRIFAWTLREGWNVRAKVDEFDDVGALMTFLMQLAAFEMVTGSHIYAIPYLRQMRAVIESSSDQRIKQPAEGTWLATQLRGSMSALNDSSMPHRIGFISGNTGKLDEPLLSLLSKSTDMTRTGFESLDEASISLENLLGWSRDIELALLRNGQHCLWSKHAYLAATVDDCTRTCLAYCLSRIVDLDALLSKQIRNVTDSYQAWRRKFAVFVRQSDQEPTSAMLFLQVRAFSSLLFLMTCRQTEERTCDRFTQDIAWAVSTAAQYFEKRRKLQPVSLPSEQGTAPRISNLLEWGMLHALYQMCAKCRDPSIRRKAHGLLSRARRRDGPLESDTLAMYARAIIQLEEHLAGDIPKETFALPGLFADAVPEYARFSDVVALSRPDDTTSFRLVCGRFKHEESGQIEVCAYQFIAMPAVGGGEMPFNIVEEPGRIEIPCFDSYRQPSGKSIQQDNVAPMAVTLPVLSRPVVVNS